MRRAHRIALVGVAAAGVALVPGTAGATPPTGVSAKILAQTTVGGKDFILREITVAPGGSTGWHFHDGTLKRRAEIVTNITGNRRQLRNLIPDGRLQPAETEIVVARIHHHIAAQAAVD